MKTNLLRTAALCAISAGSMVFYGCTSCGSGGMAGTYSDPSGAVLLELKSGGKANFTFMGEVADCTYTTSRPHVNVNCKGNAGNFVMTVHDDDSLTGPPGSFMPRLLKEKK
jgi:hypothetical protein